MNTVSVQEFQRDPLGLLSRVAAGERLLVVRGDEPLAELRPVSPAGAAPAPRPFGLCAGAFTVPDDFDAPLPEDIWRRFDRRPAL